MKTVQSVQAKAASQIHRIANDVNSTSPDRKRVLIPLARNAINALNRQVQRSDADIQERLDKQAAKLARRAKRGR